MCEFHRARGQSCLATEQSRGEKVKYVAEQEARRTLAALAPLCVPMAVVGCQCPRDVLYSVGRGGGS